MENLITAIVVSSCTVVNAISIEFVLFGLWIPKLMDKAIFSDEHISLVVVLNLIMRYRSLTIYAISPTAWSVSG